MKTNLRVTHNEPYPNIRGVRPSVSVPPCAVNDWAITQARCGSYFRLLDGHSSKARFTDRGAYSPSVLTIQVPELNGTLLSSRPKRWGVAVARPT